ncbi:MAG: NIL domain-containing protein [Desulfobacterales bacterium]
MIKTKLAFIFPEKTVEEPITYHLITDYGVRVNILRASIDPGKQGRMVVELSGEEVQISQALNYLESIGVLVSPLAQKIRHLEDRCTGCTACVPHCPTQALDVDRDLWKVSFDPEKCIVCFSCLETCIYHAMAVEEQFA